MIRLENGDLRLEVMPEMGGKIWTFEDLKLGRQFLWQQPGLTPRPLPPGSDYDSNFFGGMDELVPNDIPEAGLPDHGELWTTALAPRWEGESLLLEGRLPSTPLSYSKRLSLEGRTLRLDYQLRNLGAEPLDLLWKLHPALKVSGGCEIRVPARRAEVAHPDYSSRPLPERFAWDSDPSRKRVPARGDYKDFLYLLDLEEGSCALAHEGENWLFKMRFDKGVFGSVWIFASYAGWMNHEVLVLEPCSNPHLSLLKCAADKSCLRLEPGAGLRTSVTMESGPYTP